MYNWDRWLLQGEVRVGGNLHGHGFNGRVLRPELGALAESVQRRVAALQASLPASACCAPDVEAYASRLVINFGTGWSANEQHAIVGVFVEGAMYRSSGKRGEPRSAEWDLELKREDYARVEFCR